MEVAAHRAHSTHVKDLLRSRKWAGFCVTEPIVKECAAQSLNGGEVMKLLLDQRLRRNVPITEDVLLVAAANPLCGDEIMKAILDRRRNEGRNIPITKDVLRRAVANPGCGHGIITAILELDGGRNIPIIEDVLYRAPANFFRAHEITKEILSPRIDNIIITAAEAKVSEEALVAAAAAAGYWYSDKGERASPMALLLKHQKSLKISERVMIAAAGNGSDGANVVKLLLEYGKGALVTYEVLERVCCNIPSGDKIMALLVDHFSAAGPILSASIAMDLTNKRLELQRLYRSKRKALGNMVASSSSGFENSSDGTFGSFYLVISRGLLGAGSLDICLKNMFPSYRDFHLSKLKVSPEYLLFLTISTLDC